MAISVADHGVGVSPERLPYLFRRFFRAEGDQGDGVGAGLGLAICKGIVEAHGGRIRAESDGPGRGATFTFTLPAAIELMQDILRIADVPVIFLSGYGQDQVIARAFSPTELAARVQAALRRRTGPGRLAPSEPYVRGELTIDYAQRLVSVAGEPVRLTAVEYDLLRELWVHAGRVLTHQHLLQRVWGQTKPGTPRVIRTHLMRLRRKPGEDGDNPRYIFAEPRVGYRMERPDARTPGE